MSVFHNNVIAGAAGQTGAAAEYVISKSVRFNSGDSAYLNRTPSSAGSQTTWTWSCWLKRSSLGDDAFIGENGGYPNASAFFQSDGKIRFTAADASSAVFLDLITTQRFRDVSAWYHIVCVLDTTNSTTADRARIYINGTRVTQFSTATYPSQNATTIFNAASNEMRIGQHSGVSYFDGYMADIQFVDGQALAASDFGKTRESDGVWVPKEYEGTYGTNGFHLFDFANESTIGHDSSGNNNDFTANNFSNIDGIFESTSNFSGSGTTYGSLSVILDNDTTTGYSVQAGTLTYTPASAISVSSQIKFWYSTDQSNTRFRVNSGSWITLSDPNGVGTYTHSFSGSLTKIEWNAPSSSELVGVHQIEIDSKTLVSAAALAGNDVLFDVPTNGTQSDTGAGGEVSGNYPTFNPLMYQSTSAMTNGNLDIAPGGGSYGTAEATVGVSSGKWYWEVTVNTATTSAFIGIKKPTDGLGTFIGNTANSYSYTSNNKYNNGVNVSYGASFGAGDVIGVALDLDNGNLVFYKNGSSQGTAYTGLSGTFMPAISEGGGGNVTLSINFGQRAFANSAPADHKCINTANLPTPTVGDGSAHFTTNLWSGNDGATRDITTSFAPDLVWIKGRNVTNGHFVTDTVRGKEKNLFPHATDQEEDPPVYGKIDPFLTDGFRVKYGNHGSDSLRDVNKSGSTYVSWAWNAGSSSASSNDDGGITSSVKVNSDAGFSIGTFTGTGSVNTVGTGLSNTKMVILKNRDSTSNWVVYHTLADGSYDYMYLNLKNANASSSLSHTMTDTFKVGSNTDTNASGDDYVFYAFSPVAGYSAMGKYRGDGETGGDGPFVYTGFRPAFVLIKANNSGDDAHWGIWDGARLGYNANGGNPILYPNRATDEYGGDEYNIDLLSNGFKLRVSFQPGINFDNTDHYYMAFAENPFQANGGIAR